MRKVNGIIISGQPDVCWDLHVMAGAYQQGGQNCRDAIVVKVKPHNLFSRARSCGDSNFGLPL